MVKDILETANIIYKPHEEKAFKQRSKDKFKTKKLKHEQRNYETHKTNSFKYV